MNFKSFIKCLILMTCLIAGTQANNKIIGQTSSRVLVNLPLDLIYPYSESLIDVNLVQTNSTPHDFDYNLIVENKTIYFLASVNNPADLKVNLALIDQEDDIKHRSRDIEISIDIKSGYEVRNIFEVSFHDVTLVELMEAEESIKNHFSTLLWNLEGRYWSTRSVSAIMSRSFNDKLDIKYIKPISESKSDRDVTSFRVGIGSWYPLSDVLQSLFVLKKENDCNTVEDHKLIKFKSATNLDFDLCSIKTYTPLASSSAKQNIIVNAEYTLATPGLSLKTIIFSLIAVIIVIGVFIKSI